METSGFSWTRAGAIVLGFTVLLAAHARAAVPPGDYCLSGLGDKEDSTVDGWVGVVTRTPVATFTDLTPQLTTALIDAWDCAIDPTNGDIIVIDEGPNGSGTNGSLRRLTVVGGTVTAEVMLHGPGGLLVNPHGVAVGQDGTIYVADSGAAVNNNAFDGAVYAYPVGGPLARLDTPGGIQDASDVDIDPKPFGGVVNLIILDSRNGQFRRVPLTGGAVVNMAGNMGGNDWESMEVGPYGNYFALRDGDQLQRYDRLATTNTQVQKGGAIKDPLGITVDYYTGDLVVADKDKGVVDVPPNVYVAGGPAATNLIPKNSLPDDPAGIGFSPPLASSLPSANLGMPTRRAPIPGAGITQHGAGTSAANGDVEYRQDFFIEVTDVSQPLMVRIFDANVRDGYDGPVGGFGSNAIYTLRDPAGVVLTSVTIPGNGRVDLDQRIATLNSGNTLTMRGAGVNLSGSAPGLYQLTATISSDDFNSWGVWVENFNTYSYTTIYGALNTFTGPNPQLTPLDVQNLHPYFDRGCEYNSTNWDLDFPFRTASLGVTTRLGTAIALTGTTNNQHLENVISPLAPNMANDYGLHSTASILSFAYNENNIVTVRYPDFQGWVNDGPTTAPIPVPPGNPAVNPTPALQASPAPAYPTPPAPGGPNSFLRQYVPRYDEAPGPLGAQAMPYAPYLRHEAILLSAPSPPNTPTVGTTDYYAILVHLMNPDPVNALGAGRLTVPVPAPTQYVEGGFGGVKPASSFGFNGPSPQVTRPCSPGPCSGNLFVDFTGVNPGTQATLTYFVAVTPTAPGQTLYLTEGPPLKGGGIAPLPNAAPWGGVGTSATFIPAWQSGTFPRVESLGPICDLSVVEGSVVPVAVDLASFEATGGDGEVLVTWETASEFENLGFDVYRQLAGEAEPTRLTERLLLGRGTTDLSARYAFLDTTAPNGVAADYWIEDIEFNGSITRHGPVSATPQAGATAVAWNPGDYASAQVMPNPGAAAEPAGATGPSDPAGNVANAGSGGALAANDPEAAPTGSGTNTPAPAGEALLGASNAEAAGSPGVKIGARGPGPVRVSAEELLAAGLAAGTDPRSLRMLRQGADVAVRIDGEADGRLDPGDALLFWSEGHADRYSDLEVFFLVADAGAGPRMAPESAGPSGGAPRTSAEASALREDQSLYLPGVLNGEGDNYVGAYVFDSPVATTVPTPASLAAEGWLTLRLRGGTSYAGVEADHHFSVRVGGQELIDARFDGTELFEASVALPAGLLGGEEVVVEIVPLFDSGAPFDLIYVDAVEIAHSRALELRAEDAGGLVFVAEVDADHEIGGLVDPATVEVWDVSAPGAPVELAGLARGDDSVGFRARAGHRYAVIETPLAAETVTDNQPSQWADAPPGGGAEWLAIAHGSLIDGLDPLVALRESQGLATAVVDVEDVYDEFAGGRFTPEAIRGFVAHARAHWNPAPRYLLLVGDASYDYRDHLGGSAENLVPTMLVDTTFVEAGSDGWLASETDDLPRLAVGRLPVSDTAALDAVVAKLVAYETGSAGEGWQDRLMLVADDGGGLGIPAEATNFEATLDAFTARAPSGFDVRRLALADLPEARQAEAANAWIRDTLQEGAGLAVYVGHGGARMWADEIIFGSDDFASLENPRWPFFVVLNCLNAFFDAPNEESLSEVVLRSEGRGGVAFISSTTVSPLAGQTAFAEALADRVLAAGERRVGDAFLQALEAIAPGEDSSDVLRSFVLMGDPATRLGLPEVPVADAGPDREARARMAIRLDGRGSHAPDGGPLGYTWQVVSGPESLELSEPGTPQPGFRATLPGLYRVELRVDDGQHGSAPDVVEIEVRASPAFGCGRDSGPQQTARLGPELLYLLLTVLLARPVVRLGR